MRQRITTMPTDMAIMHIVERAGAICRAIARGSPQEAASAARMMRYDCIEIESVCNRLADILREGDCPEEQEIDSEVSPLP